MKHEAILLFAVVFLLQVTGCIAIPLPALEGQVGREDIETLKPGLTKREQIHEALGDPNSIVTDRYEIFNVGEESFNLVIVGMVPPWGFFGEVTPIGRRSYRVLAEYGADNILRDLLWEGSDESPSEEPLPSASWNWIYWFVSVSPDGRLLAQSRSSNTFSQTPMIVLHDGRTGAPIAKIYAIPGCQPLSSSRESGTVFLSDSEHLASIAEKGTLCIWNAATKMSIRELAGGEELWNLVSARSEPTIAAIDAKNRTRFRIRLWNGLTGSEISTITPCRSDDSCRNPKMALSDDGQLLATLQDSWARPEGHWKYELQGYGVRLWDVETGAELAAFEITHTPDSEPELAVSPDLRRVAVHVGDHVEIWRVNELPGPAWRRGEHLVQPPPWSAELERVLILPPTLASFTPANSVAFSTDGRKLAASSSSMVMWEVGTWREVWRADAFPSDFFLTADGRRIITRSGSWEVPELDKSFDLSSGMFFPTRDATALSVPMPLSSAEAAPGQRR